MLFDPDRSDARQSLYAVWDKKQNQQILSPLEDKIWQIILAHPEYHSMFENREKFLDKDFHPDSGETNPFLHMDLHLVLLEQISIDQPKGIRKLYRQTMETFGDPHEAQHCIMNSLVMGLHETLHEKKPFNEKAYLKRIKIAIKNGYW